MNKGKFIIGTLMGAAAGVVAGLLTAPKSGEETRSDLKAKAAELKKEAARRAGGMRTDTGDTMGASRGQGENAGRSQREGR